jgi:hypothetical protein
VLVSAKISKHCPSETKKWYSGSSSDENEEDDMRKGIILLAIGTLALLAGCDNQGNKASGIPVGPKWKGAPYRISLDTKAGKPNPAGVTIPMIKYTANPNALEKRVSLVVRFDTTAAKEEGSPTNKMIMAPVDISGETGALPAAYMDTADKQLSTFLGAYCMKGKVKISVAIARSSLTSRAIDEEVEAKRLSDWLPVEVVFKNPHPKC